MGKCKVRVHHLTLDLGSSGVSEVIVEVDREVAEARRILDRESHHCSLEISVDASSACRVLPHVHGVESEL
jgi:hypothetical protein